LKKIEEGLDILDTIPFGLISDYDKLKQNNKYFSFRPFSSYFIKTSINFGKISSDENRKKKILNKKFKNI
jgi:hypothetical protein